MPTDFKWKTAETLTSLLTTELNSLANSTTISTGKVLAGAIANQTDLFEFISFQLSVTYGTTPTAGAYVGLWLVKSLDATVYEEGSTTIDPARNEDVYLPLLLSTAAQVISVTGIVIPPFAFKVLVRNKAGQAMAASGNILKYSRYIENGV